MIIDIQRLILFMHKIDIESSLRKINNKFVQNLSYEEKQKAVESFKKVYAEEMSRASGGINRKKKIQENLELLQMSNDLQKHTIEHQLSKKMVTTEKNRQKSIESKMKQHKLLQQNWKRRWQSMAQKRRFSQMQSFQKAEKIRKQTQQFFVKKQSFFKTSQTKKSNKSLDNSQIPYHKNHPKSIFSKERKSASIDHNLYKVDLPSIEKSKKQFQVFELTENTNEKSLFKKGAEIKFNHQKFQKEKKEKEYQVFEKMISKLQKIQKNRHHVQQRRERIIMLAKQARQQRQDPQKLARNRQKSLEDLNFRRRVKDATQRSKSKQIQKIKSNLDASIYQHIQAKKSIEQLQFKQREKNYQKKFQKLKKNKMQKLIKQAVLTFKNQTLNHKDK